MTQELVQISPIDKPPLHQSTETIMACPVFYVQGVIKKRRKPGGMESARGNQVHGALAKYNEHCAKEGVAMDVDAFDAFARGAGPMAARILSGMRDSYQVDFKHLLATEITFNLDEEFNPTQVPKEAQSEVEDSREAIAYQGTLDALLAFREEGKIQIDDAKSHPRPFNPDDTLQGRMYSLFCFLHFPWAQEVKFRLVFVRYHNLTREVVYTREDVPKLIEVVRAARARQDMLHQIFAADDPIEAIPGSHCIYCPLLADRSCPIAEYNENMQLSPEQRLKFHLWYAAFSQVNNKALRDYVQESGKDVVLRDFNGKHYVFGPKEKESLAYPVFKKTANGIAFRCQNCGLEIDRAVEHGACPHCGKMMIPVMPIIELINDYAYATPEDVKWMGNLLLSSTKLSGPLATKKRAMLDQAVTDSADHITKAEVRASKPLDTLQEEEPEDREEWDDEF